MKRAKFAMLGTVLLAAIGLLAIMRYVERRRHEQELDRALYFAVYKRDPEALKQALRQGADPDGRRGNVGTVTFWSALNDLLHHTSLSPGVGMTPLGIESRMAPVQWSYINSVPIEQAVLNEPMKEHLAMMRMLLDHGADPNRGHPAPLDNAVMSSCSENVALLMERGARLTGGVGGGTPVFYAVSSKGRPGMLKAMLDHGVDPNLRSPDGNTLLMLAVTSIWPEDVQIIIDHGADVNARNGEGKTALDIVLADQAKEGACFKTLELVQHTAGVGHLHAAQPPGFRAPTRREDLVGTQMYNREQYNREATIIAMLRKAGAKP